MVAMSPAAPRDRGLRRLNVAAGLRVQTASTTTERAMKPSHPPAVRRTPPLRRRGAARAIAEHPPEQAAGNGLVEHPDGWYWVAADGLQQFGPFETGQQARADRDRSSEQSVDDFETEREAEIDLGVADAVHEDRDALDPDR
jgi:hypothetical protein